jgi:flagellar biosynthesis GTPase FlhF
MNWTARHAKILREVFTQLQNQKIDFFIIRNFEGLPEINNSKDIDIIIRPGYKKAAESIVKNVFLRFGLSHYYSMKIEETVQIRGIDINSNFSIHIDLMNGYINRGVEIISFDELYANTYNYNGFRVMNSTYNGLMLFIYKQFGYKKPYLKPKYQQDIYNTWRSDDFFSSKLRLMIGEKLCNIIESCIKNKDFDRMLKYSPEVTKQLRAYSYKHTPIKNTLRWMSFVLQKINRIILFYREYEKSFSVMAPDGTGKTTFLEKLLDELDFLYGDGGSLNRFSVFSESLTIGWIMCLVG